MNGIDEGSMVPQTFLYGCVLEAGKEVVFNPEDDEFEHQLDLRMACVDPSTKDELNMVEVEGQDLEGQKIKAGLVSLKPSTLPSVSLGGFTIMPPVVFRLKAGSGPVHISGQHLVMMDAETTFEEEGDSEEEEEGEEDVRTSRKRPASSPAAKSQKKMKIEEEEEEDDDDDDEDEDDDDDDDDEDDEDDDDDEEEEEEEELPPKVAKKAAPEQTPAKNGKGPKPSTTPTQKTPKRKRDKSKSVSPKGSFTVDEVKAKIMELVKRGNSLPKLQTKFENMVKNCFRPAEPQMIAELWTWRQTIKDSK